MDRTKLAGLAWNGENRPPKSGEYFINDCGHIEIASHDWSHYANSSRDILTIREFEIQERADHAHVLFHSGSVVRTSPETIPLLQQETWYWEKPYGRAATTRTHDKYTESQMRSLYGDFEQWRKVEDSDNAKGL